MRNSKTKRIYLSFATLFIAIIVLIVINFMMGSINISFKELLESFDAGSDSVMHNIIWQIRAPRIVAALILGGALSVSGYLLQTFFANPIAGPFVLGISSGAKLFVALAMIAFLSRGISLGSLSLILAAFAGSITSMGFILVISKGVKRMSMLVICGVMIGYICSAITDFVVTFADDSNIVNLHNWSLGSFSGTTWNNVSIMLIIVIITVIFSFMISKQISAYQLGEDYAINSGVNIKKLRVELILLSSILAACVTAFAGPISFVGIAVPHLMKNLFKTSKPIIMIPACFLGGSVICIFCDLMARYVFSPTELSISSVTAIFLAPVVIYMMLSGSRSR